MLNLAGSLDKTVHSKMIIIFFYFKIFTLMLFKICKGDVLKKCLHFLKKYWIFIQIFVKSYRFGMTCG